jgi:hypothetical protein
MHNLSGPLFGEDNTLSNIRFAHILTWPWMIRDIQTAMFGSLLLFKALHFMTWIEVW